MQLSPTSSAVPYGFPLSCFELQLWNAHTTPISNLIWKQTTLKLQVLFLKAACSSIYWETLLFCLLLNRGHHLLCRCFKVDSDLSLVYFYNPHPTQGINHPEGHLFLPVISQEMLLKLSSVQCAIQKCVADDFNTHYIFISYRERQRWGNTSRFICVNDNCFPII